MNEKNTVTEVSINWPSAHRAVKAATDKALELGVTINAAVVDRGGNLMAFIRMNGAPLHSISIAQDKAYTALSFGFNTADWMDEIGDIPQLREGLVHRERLVIFGGGLPIQINDEIIGAIGVSGASEEEDGFCAEAGVQFLSGLSSE